MKSKSANPIPLYITGAVLLFAVLLHVLSRNSATRQDHTRTRGVQLALVAEQVEALTYDARVKLGASVNDQGYVARNMATLFFDDVAVEKVN